jgi:hypothetical protein
MKYLSLYLGPDCILGDWNDELISRSAPLHRIRPRCRGISIPAPPRTLCFCVSSGGNLSLSELESFQSRFLNSFSSGFELFEATHQHCMIASGVSVETPFSRDKILVTLLRGCGEESAIHAFSLQIARLGSVWTHGFFESFAGYVRQSVCVNADMRLINTYAVAAGLPKIEISTEVLLKLDAIQRILRECIGAFDLPEARVN